MLTYRTHIYTLVMGASAEATKLAVALSDCVSEWKLESERDARESIVDKHLPRLRDDESSLSIAIDKLSESIPSEVRNEIITTTNLLRHRYWIRHWLAEGLPGGCLQDPVDMVRLDLPGVLACFERWYEKQSPTDSALGERVEPLIALGQHRTALRDAWPLFKTRMVNTFDLSDDLDGERLVNKLFGSSGATAELLPNHEREGYLNLFKGLYTLSRNPVAHGDVPENPEESSAILVLINSVLVRIANAVSVRGFANTVQPSARRQG